MKKNHQKDKKTKRQKDKKKNKTKHPKKKMHRILSAENEKREEKMHFFLKF